MPQCLPARPNPVSATDNPISMIVGATVSGPMKRRRTLTIPLAPIMISKIAATIMLPTSCNMKEMSSLIIMYIMIYVFAYITIVLVFLINLKYKRQNMSHGGCMHLSKRTVRFRKYFSPDWLHTYVYTYKSVKYMI